MARQKNPLPLGVTFQIDAYERDRLKSFPPRATPKRRIIRFGLPTACEHSRRLSCPKCLLAESQNSLHKTSGDTKAIAGYLGNGWPGRHSKANDTIITSPPRPKSLLNGHMDKSEGTADVLLWWPSLSKSNCTEPLSTRGVQVSHNLFQAVQSDRIAFAALSALVSTYDLVASPEYDGAKTCGRILKQKQRVCSMLRKRLENDDSISDQVIMTIFFLLTFDLFDVTESISSTWEVHLRAIEVLAATSNGDRHFIFPGHLKSRTNTWDIFFYHAPELMAE